MCLLVVRPTVYTGGGHFHISAIQFVCPNLSLDSLTMVDLDSW